MQAHTKDKWFDFLLGSDIDENCELTHHVRYNHQLGLGSKFLRKNITDHNFIDVLKSELAGQDVDVIAVDVTASQTTADIVQLTADSVTTAKVIDISADALTTGSALYIDSDSASTGTRSLATIIQNHTSATGATGLTVQADAGRGIFINSDLAAGGPSLEIDAEQATTTAVDFNFDAATSATAMSISADGLTTGSAFKVDSDSSSTGTRNLVEIIQNHASATGATALKVQQDSSGDAAVFQGGNIRVTKGGSAFQTSQHHAWVMGG